MNVRLATGSAVPIYRQIVDQVTYQVASGVLAVGDKLPSVRELARALPANQNTVLKAYEILERDGLLDRRHGDGTYVAGNGSPLSPRARRSILREILAQAAAKAAALDVSADELRKLLDEQIESIANPRSVGPPCPTPNGPASPAPSPTPKPPSGTEARRHGNAVTRTSGASGDSP